MHFLRRFVQHLLLGSEVLGLPRLSPMCWIVYLVISETVRPEFFSEIAAGSCVERRPGEDDVSPITCAGSPTEAALLRLPLRRFRLTC